MTETMVEWVAHALTGTFAKLEGRSFDYGHAEMLAVAAIEAMREPTDEMHAAGETADKYFSEASPHVASLFIYYAMIDAALSRTRGEKEDG